MKRTRITITCPGSCGYERTFEPATARIDELRDQLDADGAIEDAVLDDLLQEWSRCPTCETPYAAEVGDSVERDGMSSVEAGP